MSDAFLKVNFKSGGNANITFNNYQIPTEVKYKTYNTSFFGYTSTKQVCSTTVSNYALFAGGKKSSSAPYSNEVIAYSTSLARTTPTPLSQARVLSAATTVGNYALIGGGAGNNTTIYNTVDAYNDFLTRTTPTPLSKERYFLAATTVGNYALFGGGTDEIDVTYFNTVDAYDTSLTRTTPTPLSQARCQLAATTVGHYPSVAHYALFGGGSEYRTSDVVDAYDTSLTRTTPTALSQKTQFVVATTLGNYALFTNGNYVDAYDNTLTKTVATPFSVSRAPSGLTATTLSGYALFSGGNIYTKLVEAYDSNLTRSNPTSLKKIEFNAFSATIGNYALFASNQYLEILVPDNSIDVTIFPGTKYKFGSDSETTSPVTQTLNLSGTLNGYIKYSKTLLS